ncbi:MAG: NAD(P)H-dependent oxidoreductase [Verrucomicrobiota bacterium]|nr:NAD(P)H-dependent oxidoreductase [Verrucomicrobiota bacterium]
MSEVRPTLYCAAISGSLRSGSSNTRLLDTAARCAPSHLRIERYRAVGDLPHFNPDNAPRDFPVVEQFIEMMRRADGVIVSTPEYAGGLPGTFKNALDWLVGSDAFVRKPFMLLKASSRALRAQLATVEILTTMSGVEISDASATIPLLGQNLDVLEILWRPDYVTAIQASLARFAAGIRVMRHQSKVN